MKAPLRILHLASGNLHGGVETFLATLARHADSAPGLDQQFALCFEGRLAEDLRAIGCRTHVLSAPRLRNPWSVRRSRSDLRRLMEMERIDVMICHSAWGLAVFGPALRAGGADLIYWLHDRPDPGHWLYRLARRNRPDMVICNSNYVKELLPGLYAGVPSRVVRYPVDAQVVESPEQARRDVRGELGTSEDSVVVMQVSRMEAWKGQRLHLRGLALLRDLPGWTLWIAGGAQRPAEVEYLEGLETLARELSLEGRVRFIGQRSDVPRLLAASDIQCQPNEGPEPFGIVFVEALYAGLPCVTTDMGGAREIVTAECGVRVAPDDPAALAGALRVLIESEELRRRLGSAGPARAAELCAPEARVAELEEVLAGFRRPRERSA